MPYRKSVARNTCALIGKSPIFRIAVKSVEYYLKNYFKPLFGIFLILLRCAKMCANVYVYGKLRVCERRFSVGKSEASKQSNSHWLRIKLAIFYIRLVVCRIFLSVPVF